MNYDVIIIGAGLGGLTAGAKLSKEGKKVLIVEQHIVPGGCATTYKRKGFSLEVGLHEMDGFQKRDLKSRIFRDLDVFNHVDFIKVPDFYTFKYKNYNITVPHEPDEAKAILLTHFPEEAEGIDAYFYQVLNAKEIIKNSKGKEERNLGEFMDSIIKNKDLKLALLSNLGYFHDDPYSLSLSYYSMAQGSYYAGGGYFIKGGSQKLSDYLSEFITKNGGQVILNHIVTEIIVENNKAIGISYKKKKTDNILKAHGTHIVSNAAIPYIAENLLPKMQADILKSDVQKRRIGASLLTIYLGFKKPVKELGFKQYSTFVFDDSVESIKDISTNNQGDFDKRNFTFIDYSQIDSALAPEGKSVGAICCVDYTKDWELLDKKEYNAQKERIAQMYIEKLNNLIPGIKDIIEYYEVGTSKTVERYTLNPQGAVYGFAQTPGRTKVNPIKSVKNLYFASAWTKIGGGFSGAIFNGYMCAFEIMRAK